MRTFYNIQFGDLTPLEVQHLEKALATDYQGTDIYTLRKLAEERKVQIFRAVIRDASGVFVTQLIENPGGTEFYVWLMAGRGLKPHTAWIIGQIRFLAKALRCRWVRSLSIPAVARHLERQTPMEPKYVCMLMELED